MKSAMLNGKIVEADTYTGKLNNKFKCINEKCDAKLHYVSSNGSRIPYFRTNPNNPHIPNCDYYYNGGGNIKYTGTNFNLKDSLKYIINFSSKAGSKSNHKPKNKILKKNNKSETFPRNIKSIYSALLQNINGSFGDIKNVNDVLCCEATRDQHSILNGILLVKAKVGYDPKEENTLGLFYPTLYSENQIKLKVRFSNPIFFKQFSSKCINNKEFPILIFAEFNNNSCLVENSTQIAILNND